MSEYEIHETFSDRVGIGDHLTPDAIGGLEGGYHHSSRDFSVVHRVTWVGDPDIDGYRPIFLDGGHVLQDVQPGLHTTVLRFL